MMMQTNDSATTRRIVSDLDASFIVEAGAGTGKTYALVSRVVALVKAGVAMPQIVAITFTEAAAAELAERVRSRMEQLLDAAHPANADDLLYQNLDATHRQRIQTAINELDQASIQTIHSFAAQLLRERPLDAGLPPGWATLDEVESKDHFAARWDEWLEESLSRDCDDADLQTVLRHLLSAKVGTKSWQDIAQSFANHQDRLGDGSSLPAIDLIAATQGTLEKLQELASECTNRADRLFEQLNGAIETVNAIAAVADDPVAALNALASGAPVNPAGNVGVRNNWNRPPAAVRGDFRTFGESFQATVKAGPLIPLLHNLRQRFAVDYAARRKANGMATFDDLLVWARDLLRDNAAARAHFQQKYSHLLIDEFQDTDPLQAEIAFYLAAADDANANISGGADWHTLPLTPGKLFIVGDDKQSIYRFRNADLGVVQRVKDGGQLERLTISENRRSQQPVLDWVNAVFGGPDTPPDPDQSADPDQPVGGLMQPEPGVQAQYVPLQPNAGVQQAGLGTVQIFGAPADDSADAVRSRQSQHVANLIAAYTGDGAPQRREVYDKEIQSRRPADLGDVCILIRSRTGLGLLTRALESAQIPYRLEGASLYFDAQEVQDLLNCLRAIDDPADAVSVAAALRSPALACSDADLLRWRDTAGPRWNYMAQLPDTASPVRDGMQILRQYHEKSRTANFALLIADFIRERRLDELDLDPDERRPREVWRRRQFLTEQARNMEHDAAAGGTPLTLRRFLHWAETQQDEGARITETPVPETDDDAVRIMTMHAAKGLEFPIVILLGLAGAARGPGGSGVLFNPQDGTAEVAVGSQDTGLRTPGYARLADLERQHAIAENVRLAYVGATRARDHLLVSLYQTENDAKKPDEIVAAGIEQRRTEFAAAPDLDELPAAYRPVTATATPAPLDAYNPDWQDARTDAIAKRSRPQAVTATRLARDYGADAANVESKEIPADAEQRGARGRGGTAVGSAVHAVLQDIVEQMRPHLPLPAATPADDFLADWNDAVNQSALRYAKSEGVADRAEVARLALRALHHPAVITGLRAPRLWPEIPVAARVGNAPDAVVLEGIIDLLYEDDAGELVILDYKSDRVADSAAISAKMANYKWQGAAYAAAIERAAGQTVKAVQFLFIRADAVQTVDDWRELAQQIDARTRSGAV